MNVLKKILALMAVIGLGVVIGSTVGGRRTDVVINTTDVMRVSVPSEISNVSQDLPVKPEVNQTEAELNKLGFSLTNTVKFSVK